MIFFLLENISEINKLDNNRDEFNLIYSEGDVIKQKFLQSEIHIKETTHLYKIKTKKSL